MREILNLITNKICMLINFFNKDKQKDISRHTFNNLKNKIFTISSRSEELNQKFEKIIEDNTKRINNRISINQS
jgi:hypothetical protein